MFGTTTQSIPRIIHIDMPTDRRLLVVSDIHGFSHYLEGVLQKANYSTDDILVIVGDMIEKGPESLATVRFILKLREQNRHIYAVIGNVDYGKLMDFYDNSTEGDQYFLKTLKWTKQERKRGFFLDILDELSIDLDGLTLEDIPALKEKIYNHYHTELDFLWNLPTVLETGNFIFVHAGIPTDNLADLKEEDLFSYLKQDAFMDSDVSFQKIVITGHWPVCLYRDDIDSMNPFFNKEKHIIAIDGGCALKNGAQLNALVIPNVLSGMQDISYIAYDDYPTITADHDQKEIPATFVIRYFDCEVEVLSVNGDMAHLRQVNSGKEFDVPKSFFYKNKDHYYCSDYSDACLEISAGDVLSVIERTSEGYIVKKEGIIGWYR